MKSSIILGLFVVGSLVLCGHAATIEEFDPGNRISSQNYLMDSADLRVYYDKKERRLYNGSSLESAFAGPHGDRDGKQNFARNVGDVLKSFNDEIPGSTYNIGDTCTYDLGGHGHNLGLLRESYEKKENDSQSAGAWKTFKTPFTKNFWRNVAVGAAIGFASDSVDYINPIASWEDEFFLRKYRNVFVGAAIGAGISLWSADKRKNENFFKESLKKKKWWPFYQDRRSIVNGEDTFPWCVHGELQMEYLLRGKIVSRGFGSGTLIGDKYVLTAAHNFYSVVTTREGPLHLVPDFVTFFPAKQGKNVPFGAARGDKIIIPKGYIENTQDYTKDIALLRVGKLLNLDYTSTLLDTYPGNALGHFGVKSLSEGVRESLSLRITGYPGEKKGKMYTMEGFLRGIRDGRMFYDIDTTAGQSGSAVCDLGTTNTSFHSMVCGVHTNGWEADVVSQHNNGTHISEKHLYTLNEWVKL